MLLRTRRGVVCAMTRLPMQSDSRWPVTAEYAAHTARKRQKCRCRLMSAGISHRPARLTY